ncbi:GAF domain-containing protein [Pseudoalteromonas sp. BDTF-M6]|uniref:GAF domain-containing protein n=1 Tax=Pseudoalteromonas sp. BDTF-M6 TaxID=2796132 RepID=UPI001BB0C4B7|nr:GAF domain-containing protein [Pseudoalteromonas sp. BDTF-M6]MBS3798870.1 GAF domain-containing protein [Pseudoalteromonas sp. BDTF-M6]
MISYNEQAHLDADAALTEKYQALLTEYLATASAQVQWQYLIPELGEGGACSLFGHLQEEPFSLREHLDGGAEERLATLQAIVDFVVEQSGVDWFGIYQARDIDGQWQLLKLAYYGAPSRPLFPITPEFAATSNNVQVASSGKARIINNVEDYVASGGEYYTCDPKVKAESCLPLYSQEGKVVGIVDAEAFSTDFFTPERIALLVAASKEIVAHLPA